MTETTDNQDQFVPWVNATEIPIHSYFRSIFWAEDAWSIPIGCNRSSLIFAFDDGTNIFVHEVSFQKLFDYWRWSNSPIDEGRICGSPVSDEPKTIIVKALNHKLRNDYEDLFTINVGDRFQCKQIASITNLHLPVESGTIGTVIQTFGKSSLLKFCDRPHVLSNETLRKDFEKLPPDSAVPTNDSMSGAASVAPAATGDRDKGTGIKYWDAPWCQGVWWNEFNDYAIYYHLIDPAMDYGKGRWVKIEKPPFPPQPDPLEENVKSIIAELSNVDDLTRDVGAIIKKHFADWEPKE